jgi:TPR repeat protein
MTNYEKYIKYKNKYINLKNIQYGGLDCINERAFKNLLGTCWMISIQMILSFSDVTNNELEVIMNNIKPIKKSINYIEELAPYKTIFINKQIDKILNNCNLKNVLPLYIFNTEKIEFLKKILHKFIDRYYSKVFYVKSDDITYFLNSSEISYNKKNPNRCELLIVQNFKKIFTDFKSTKYGGNIIEQYLFANILTIFFLDYKVSFRTYYKNNYKCINYNDSEDLGILLTLKDHVCCFFICNKKEKFYNDNDRKIFNCPWKKLLTKLDDNNDLYIKNNDCIVLNKKEYDEYKNKLELNKVNRLTVISKNINSNFDNQINNIIYDRNLHLITDIELLHCLAHQKMNDSESLQNNTEALKYYKLAADLGNINAQYNLGVIYENSDEFEQKYIESKKYYKMAARQGDIDSIVNLGNIYNNIFHNYKEAIKYYKLAADQQNIESLVNLGNIYINIYHNYTEAIKYYKLAADQQNIESIVNLGIIYNDIEHNYIEAKKYFKLAADMNNIDAQFRLGYLYENGFGTEKNLKEALKYYKLAADKEFTSAQCRLKYLYKDTKPLQWSRQSILSKIKNLFNYE